MSAVISRSNKARRPIEYGEGKLLSNTNYKTTLNNRRESSYGMPYKSSRYNDLSSQFQGHELLDTQRKYGNSTDSLFPDVIHNPHIQENRRENRQDENTFSRSSIFRGERSGPTYRYEPDGECNSQHSLFTAPTDWYQDNLSISTVTGGRHPRMMRTLSVPRMIPTPTTHTYGSHRAGKFTSDEYVDHRAPDGYRFMIRTLIHMIENHCRTMCMIRCT